MSRPRDISGATGEARAERGVLGASAASCNFLGVVVTQGFSGRCPCSSAVYPGFWAKGQDVCNPCCGSAKIHLWEREKAMHSKGGGDYKGVHAIFLKDTHLPPLQPQAVKGSGVGEATPASASPPHFLAFLSLATRCLHGPC